MLATSSVNLKQLATQLGVSSSTVSRALRDSYEISSATRQRVQQLARQLDYQPNPIASNLRSSVSKTIGVILPQVDNPFFALAINGIEEEAQRNGYHVLIYLTHDKSEQEKQVAKFMTGGRVDGILLALASGTRGVGHFDKLKQLGLPIVQFDRVNDSLGTPTVTTDDYTSSYQATQHLLEAGCRTIAHLRLAECLSISSKRLQGYQAALHDHHIAFDPSLVLNGTNASEENVRRITQLLEERPTIDGIFASVERLALNSYQACQTLGIAIPQQLKIIGFSNTETASLLAPSLSTITQPAHAIGKEAARILLQALTKHRLVLPTQSVELKSELIIRASTSKQPVK
jgi:LacI family transcriptional regulator